MLFPPESEADAARWAATFAGHAALGVVIAAALAWIGAPVWAAPVIYLAVWEIGVQRVGAGWADAVVDSWAVALGVAAIWAAWERWAPGVFAASAAGCLSVWLGVRRRRERV